MFAGIEGLQPLFKRDIIEVFTQLLARCNGARDVDLLARCFKDIPHADDVFNLSFVCCTGKQLAVRMGFVVSNAFVANNAAIGILGYQ